MKRFIRNMNNSYQTQILKHNTIMLKRFINSLNILLISQIIKLCWDFIFNSLYNRTLPHVRVHSPYFKLQSNYAVHSTWFGFFWKSSKDESDYLWLLAKDREWTKRSVLEVMCFWAMLELVAFSVCGFFELLPVWRWWHIQVVFSLQIPYFT